MSIPTNFIDRIVSATVTGSLVRFELASMALPIKEGEPPTMTTNQTLVMPLNGFLQSFNMLEVFVKQVVAGGGINQQSAIEDGQVLKSK